MIATKRNYKFILMNKSIDEVAFMLLKIFLYTEILKLTKSNNAFDAKDLVNLLNCFRIDMKFAPSNSHIHLVECKIRDAKISLIKETINLFEDKENWDFALPLCMIKLNQSCKTRKISPFALITGRLFYPLDENIDEDASDEKLVKY
jgi:hypothetical protein